MIAQIFINYDEIGKAYPDFACEKTLLNAWEKVKGTTELIVFTISTENFILCARALCKQGLIPCRAIRFQYHGKNIETFYDDGTPSANWSELNCTFYTKWLNEIIIKL